MENTKNQATTLVRGEIRRGKSTVRHLFSILDGADCFIAGGFARYVCSPCPAPVLPGDIDLYCASESAFSQAQESLLRAGLTQTHDTRFSVSFRDARRRWFRRFDLVIQLVKPITLGEIALYGGIESVAAGFDLSVLCVAIVDATTAFQHPSFEEDEYHRRIVLLSIPCPYAAIYRISKYMAKGYKLPAVELTKLFATWDLKPDEYKTSVRALLEQHDRSAGYSVLMEHRL
jgi:hypothetical protein